MTPTRRFGLYSVGGILPAAGALALYAWFTIDQPRMAWRSDCEMAWATLTEPDIFYYFLAGALGAHLGSLFWGNSTGQLWHGATHPRSALLRLYLPALAAMLLALVPAVVTLLYRTAQAGGDLCVSAGGAHLLCAMAFSLAVGLVAARFANSLLALVGTLAAVGITYAAGPALTGVKLMNVGVTPLPMMDQRRSWVFVLCAGATLLLLAAALLHVTASTRSSRPVIIAAATVLIVGLAVAPSDFIQVRHERRACEQLTADKRLCIPQSYAWALPDAASQARHMLRSAEASGIRMDLLPRTFDLGRHQGVSRRDTAEMTLTSQVASDGSIPLLEVAALLVTPSWCPQMRADTPPEHLLRGSSEAALWMLLVGGLVDPVDITRLTPPGLMDPRAVDVHQVNAILTALRRCSATPAHDRAQP